MAFEKRLGDYWAFPVEYWGESVVLVVVAAVVPLEQGVVVVPLEQGVVVAVMVRLAGVVVLVVQHAFQPFVEPVGLLVLVVVVALPHLVAVLVVAEPPVVIYCLMAEYRGIAVEDI